METDDPKVAAIWVAWQMIKEHSAASLVGSHEQKQEKIRQLFKENYKAIAEVAGLESSVEKSE